MKWIKTTALASFLFASLLVISSCEKEAETKKVNIYSRTGILLTGAQNVPASASTASGSMDVTYDRGNKLLSYKITWSGLTGAPNGMSVYGLAPVGYLATSPGIVQVISTTGLTASSTYSGTLFIDGVYIKEQDLLNALYYIGIRTAANPNGEIRGQIKFQ
jgi:hypothetical protein